MGAGATILSGPVELLLDVPFEVGCFQVKKLIDYLTYLFGIEVRVILKLIYWPLYFICGIA